jgi:hypothetical protein
MAIGRMGAGRLLLLLLLAGLCSCGRSGGDEGRMPINVTPYYDFRGPQIAVGKYSEALAATSVPDLRATAAAMKADWLALRPEAMYVAAIRLYDLGLRDESAYWFYSAQYRGRLFEALVDTSQAESVGQQAFELRQAYSAFFQLSGQFINSYAFGDPQTLAQVLAEVQAQGQTLPDFAAMYEGVAFVPEAQWRQINEGINAGMTGLLDYVTNHGDEIRRLRAEVGMENR